MSASTTGDNDASVSVVVVSMGDLPGFHQRLTVFDPGCAQDEDLCAHQGAQAELRLALSGKPS